MRRTLHRIVVLFLKSYLCGWRGRSVRLRCHQDQKASPPFLAISVRCALLSFFALASPPFLPNPSPPAFPAQASAPFQPESQTGLGPAKEADADIFQMIEKLADLKSRSIISEEDFNAKKTELLARL